LTSLQYPLHTTPEDYAEDHRLGGREGQKNVKGTANEKRKEDKI